MANSQGKFSVNNFPPYVNTVLLGTFTGLSQNGPQLRFQGGGSGGNFFDVGQDGSGNFAVEANDAIRLTVLGAGNVGIGQTSPTQALEVTGQVFSNTGGFRFPDNTVQTTAAITTASNGLTKTANNIALGGSLTGATDVPLAGNSLTFSGAGSVGIGTSAPTSRLTVVAADNTTNLIATFQPLNLTQGVSFTYQGIAKTGTNATSDLTLDSKSTGNILLNTNGGTGNVGIGTSAPAGGLHIVTGNGGVNSASGVVMSGAPGQPAYLELRGSSASTATTPYLDFAETNNVDYSTRLISQGGVLNVNSPSTTSTIFKVNGNATVTGTLLVNTTTYSSDRRFKQNIRPLTSALASVLALRGVRYEWNALGVAHGGTAGAGQVGVIAQEIEKIYPELVATAADGYKSVNYAQLTPVLIEALKEQQAQIEALQARVAQADADHASLLTMQAQLARLLGEADGQARK